MSLQNHLHQDIQAAMQEIDSTPPPSKKSNKAKRRFIIIGLVVLLLIGGGLAGWRLFLYEASPEVEAPASATVEPAPKPEEEPEAAPAFDQAALQKALTQWGATAGGAYGVTISNQDGNILAEANSSTPYFAASIYKLYVAYVGYQKIDDGTYKLSQPYLNGWTRGKCLDEMIRTSNSPCAEKMWVELGKESLTATLKTYGLKNTSMTGLTTSSGDAAIILARISKGAGLKPASQKAFLDSMQHQIYTQALQSGFSQATVYDKVGFRGRNEYHDVAIVRFGDERTLIVSVLTTGVGTKKIAALGASVEKAAN